ncbi:hypothetical protein KAH27_05920 [bacterium]|nr:hypothetical protein [bacterium]
MSKFWFFSILFFLILNISVFGFEADSTIFLQQVKEFHTKENGLVNNKVKSICVLNNGDVYAAHKNGLSFLQDKSWTEIPAFSGINILSIASYYNKSTVLSASDIYILKDGKIDKTIRLQDIDSVAVSGHIAFGRVICATADNKLIVLNSNNGTSIKTITLPESNIRQITISSNNDIALAGAKGLYLIKAGSKTIESLNPHDNLRSWAPRDVLGITFDNDDRLWFASHQGTGVYNQKKWVLFEGKDGLPYNHFTCMGAGNDGSVWFGTKMGAIHYDGKTWEYRQGLLWLPNDHVNSIDIANNGDAWIATNGGISHIKKLPMSFAKKAQWYEEEIDRFHRRTPYEYVLYTRLKKAGDKKKSKQHDSDNDGLWTSMYGAGECFLYGATNDISARERANKAFEALKFLGDVTQGGEHSPPPGFVARTIRTVGDRNPNKGRIERDIRKKKEDDKLWKIIDPRWPLSKDGKWYWKTDTSSDELDGHYFFYALYYDLVANDEEKEIVRKYVKTLTDHIINHDFNLVDHDGLPTRWAQYNPYVMNHDKNWFTNRGLNSLSILSYLAVAEHITGDPKYRETADMLIEKHGYLQNMMNQKFQRGIGTGNQSDDEMAFMSYYHLIKYETDPERKSKYALSFMLNWQLEKPEMNPFFNFTYAAVCSGLEFTDAWGAYSLDPTGDWHKDAIETLKRFPLERFDWRHTNSKRIDIIKLPMENQGFDEGGFSGKGYRVNGKVIPVDETYFSHYNYDPWDLDRGGSGHELGDGAVYLMPYYMGLYHGFINH